MASVLKPFSNFLSPSPFQVPSSPLAIDWTHPLANGLIGCWLPGSTGVIDLTMNAPLMATQSAAAFDSAPEGVGLKSAVTASGFACTAPAAFLTTPITLYWRGFMLGVPVNNANFLAISFDNADNSPFFVVALEYRSASVLTAVWNTGGTFTTGNTVAQPSSGTHDFCGTFVAGGNSSLYLDGALIGSSSFGASQPTSSASSQLQISAYVASTTRTPNAICTMAAIWNRALSASEVQALNLAPYGLFLPAEADMPAVFLFVPPPVFVLMPQIVT